MDKRLETLLLALTEKAQALVNRAKAVGPWLPLSVASRDEGLTTLIPLRVSSRGGSEAGRAGRRRDGSLRSQEVG